MRLGTGMEQHARNQFARPAAEQGLAAVSPRPTPLRSVLVIATPLRADRLLPYLPPVEWFAGLHPILQALLATLFTWSVTALGAATVFVVRDVSRRFLDAALGFTAGVMMAASLWSLLAPAIELAREMGAPPWWPPLVGFLCGAGLMRLVDRFLPHLHLFGGLGEAEGVKTSWHRTLLLVIAIMLHNIPEGLAVGVAFGAVAAGYEGASLGAAVALAIGIGLQNWPEGLAVAAPLRREGLSTAKSFWYGQLSAIVEPVAGVVGAAAVIAMRPLLPYAMAFAAGAMIFVVIEEVVPESQRGGNGDLATLGSIAGFALMMTLDVALG
jgi:ZIP family zinc transporter